jgi:site-specific DNA-methyltransferase (adenine-specific)
MTGDVETTLSDAARRGYLRDGQPYAKGAIIDALVGVGLERGLADTAFTVVRAAIEATSTVGTIGVRAVGERRGRQYVFSGLPESDSSSTVPPVAGSPPKTIAERPGLARGLSPPAELTIHFGDNLPILRDMPSASFDLIYIDPPFNTGRAQERTRVRTVRDQNSGDRTGFHGKRYRTIKVGTASFADEFADFLEFMEPRLEEAHRLLSATGSFFLHMDYREVHYCKVLLDHLFGRDSFVNEIIWAYDYGARSKQKWPAKHDNILWYAKDPKNYTFNFDEMDRIPYMAPGLVGKEKAARGKTPTDVWWHTIVPTNSKERTGYPTQKPKGILDRIVKIHTRPGDRVLDFFAGSGTTGESAARLGRHCTLIDNNVEAMTVMAQRLSFANPVFHGWQPDIV